MKTILSILILFSRFYWIKKEIIFHSKWYIMKYHILPIITEIEKEKIFDGNFLTLKDAIMSDSFKNGILDYFLKPNDYMINTKDIAIALNMGIFGHSRKTLKKDTLIDASFYLTKKLKERFILDENLKYIISELGKDINKLSYKTNRDIIEKSFKDKKIIFKEYFDIYKSIEYTEKVTIFYPGYGKNWIDWKEDNTLQVSIYKHDTPKGFFLAGFDYKSDKNGWLRTAIRTKEKEYFNPSEKIEGELVWLY